MLQVTNKPRNIYVKLGFPENLPHTHEAGHEKWQKHALFRFQITLVSVTFFSNESLPRRVSKNKVVMPAALN